MSNLKSRLISLGTGAAMLGSVFLSHAASGAENDNPAVDLNIDETPSLRIILPDLSSHPLAGGVVVQRLCARDGLPQETCPELEINIPAPVLRHPLSSPLHQMRRELALHDLGAAPDVAQSLRGLIEANREAISNPETLAELEEVEDAILSAIEWQDLSMLDSAMQDIWNNILKLEDEFLTEAEKRLQEAEEALAEALEEGASEEVLEQLREEAQEALKEFLEEKLENAEENGLSPEQQEALEQMQEMMDELMKKMEEMGLTQEQMAEMMQQKMQQAQQSAQQSQEGQQGQQQDMDFEKMLEQMQQQMQQMQEMQEMKQDLDELIEDQETVRDETLEEALQQQQQSQPEEQPQDSQQGEPQQGNEQGEQHQGNSQKGEQQQGNQQGGQQQGSPQQGDPQKGSPQSGGEQQGGEGELSSSQLSQRQADLQQRLNDIAKQMAQNNMDPQSLQPAQEAMDQAQKHIENKENGPAVNKQEEALESMESASEQMQKQIQQQMMKMLQQGQGNQSGHDGPSTAAPPAPRLRIPSIDNDGRIEESSNPNGDLDVNPNVGGEAERGARERIRRQIEEKGGNPYLEELLENGAGPSGP